MATESDKSPGIELMDKIQNLVCNVALRPEWHKLREHILIVEELNRDYFQDMRLLQETLGNLYYSQLAYHEDFTCLECNDLVGHPMQVCPFLQKLKPYAEFATCTALPSTPQSTTLDGLSSISSARKRKEHGSGELGNSKELISNSESQTWFNTLRKFFRLGLRGNPDSTTSSRNTPPSSPPRLGT